MATSTADIFTTGEPLTDSVTYGTSSSTSSGSLPTTFGNSTNSGSTWSSSTSNNSFAGAENNPYAGGGGYAYASLGNTVVGDNQWIIGQETTPERFSKVINYTTEELVDSVIVKLSNKLSESGITSSSTGENPFAGGNNPFGSTNAPALDFLKQVYGVNFPIPESASNFLTTVYAQTLPGDSSNPFSSAGAGTSGTGGSISQQPSFDITQVVFGDSLSSGGVANRLLRLSELFKMVC